LSPLYVIKTLELTGAAYYENGGNGWNETNWVHHGIINQRNTHGYYEKHHMERNKVFIVQRCYG
jgi:hypothetical protein